MKRSETSATAWGNAVPRVIDGGASRQDQGDPDPHVRLGAIGGGLNVAHTQVRDSAADAVEKGREAWNRGKRHFPGRGEHQGSGEGRSRQGGAGRTQAAWRRWREDPTVQGGGSGRLGNGRPRDWATLAENGTRGILGREPGHDSSTPGCDELQAAVRRQFRSSWFDEFKPRVPSDVFDPPGSGDAPKPPGYGRSFRSRPVSTRVRDIPGTAGNVDPRETATAHMTKTR